MLEASYRLVRDAEAAGDLTPREWLLGPKPVAELDHPALIAGELRHGRLQRGAGEI